MLIGLARKLQYSCSRRGHRVICCDVGIWMVLLKGTKEWICSLFGLPSFCEFLFLMSRDIFVFCGDMFMNVRRTTEPAEFK